MTVTLPTAPCVVSQGTVLEDFTNMAAWTPDASVQALARHYRCQDQANKGGIVFGQKYNSTAQGWITRTGLSWDLHDLAALRLDCCKPEVGSPFILAPGVKLTLELSSTGDFSTSKMSSGLCGFVPNGDQRLTIGAAEFTPTGGESWANVMVAARIGMTCSNYGDGATHYTYSMAVLLDKIVKNPQNKALLMIGVDTSLWAGFSAFLSALDDYGLRSHAFTSMIDYDNVGDSTYSTWTQIAAAVAAGLYCVPMHTAWLLANPGAPNVRTVPPYHADDTADYPDASDTTQVQRLSYANNVLAFQRLKEIHDFYGLPWNPAVTLSHGSYPGDYEYRLLHRDMGAIATIDQPSSFAAGTPTHLWWHPLPAATGIQPLEIGGYNLPNTTTLANLTGVLDNAVLYGRQLATLFSNTTQWTDANFRAFLAAAVAYQSAGQLLIVNPAEFLAQIYTPAQIAAAADRTATLRLLRGGVC
jgi:hypothetical protein